MAMVQITHHEFGLLPINVTPKCVRGMFIGDLERTIRHQRSFVAGMGIAKGEMQHNYLDMLLAEQKRRQS